MDCHGRNARPPESSAPTTSRPWDPLNLQETVREALECVWVAGRSAATGLAGNAEMNNSAQRRSRRIRAGVCNFLPLPRASMGVPIRSPLLPARDPSSTSPDEQAPAQGARPSSGAYLMISCEPSAAFRLPSRRTGCYGRNRRSTAPRLPRCHSLDLRGAPSTEGEEGGASRRMAGGGFRGKARVPASEEETIAPFRRGILPGSIGVRRN
jgi:hypothetical protein